VRYLISKIFQFIWLCRINLTFEMSPKKIIKRRNQVI